MLKLSKLSTRSSASSGGKMARDPNHFFVFITGEYLSKGFVSIPDLIDFPKLKASPNEFCKLLDFFIMLHFYQGETNRDKVFETGYLPSLCNDFGSPYNFVDQDGLNSLNNRLQRFIQDNYGAPDQFPKLLVGRCIANGSYKSLATLEGSRFTLSNLKKVFIDNARDMYYRGSASPYNSIAKIVNPFPCNL